MLYPSIPFLSHISYLISATIPIFHIASKPPSDSSISSCYFTSFHLNPASLPSCFFNTTSQVEIRWKHSNPSLIRERRTTVRSGTQNIHIPSLRQALSRLLLHQLHPNWSQHIAMRNRETLPRSDGTVKGRGAEPRCQFWSVCRDFWGRFE